MATPIFKKKTIKEISGTRDELEANLLPDQCGITTDTDEYVWKDHAGVFHANIQGVTGPAGIGMTGLAGPVGATGLAGPAGAPGITGISGATGIGGMGATGIQGLTGAEGQEGIPGTISLAAQDYLVKQSGSDFTSSRIHEIAGGIYIDGTTTSTGHVYADSTKRVACGGGTTGGSSGSGYIGYVSLEINGTVYRLMYNSIE